MKCNVTDGWGVMATVVKRLCCAEVSAIRRWTLAVTVMLTACSSSDPDLGRVGGPLPDAGETNEDGGTDASVPVAWCAASDTEPSAYKVMAVCRRCHQNPPQFGAPFALMTWDDIQQPFGDGKRFQAMAAAVRGGTMPFQGSDIQPPVGPLGAADKATLLTWLDQGAQPVGGRACEGQ